MLPEFVRQGANMTWCANADLKAGHEGHVRVRGCDCVCKIMLLSGSGELTNWGITMKETPGGAPRGHPCRATIVYF